ncbi:hypothetical protein F4679DRAFT_586822 [Xylaria curta]|nr:hypothetical protein F4679DRAFT_586822 [Xylaria curta]
MAQLRHGGVTPEVPPPPYELFILDGEDPCQPELESDTLWENNDQEPMTTIFLYCPDTSGEWINQDWVAFMYVVCSPFPHPICKGFFWGIANVIYSAIMDIDAVKDGFLQDEKKWAGLKLYLIRDLQRPRRWVAKIQVLALCLETLHLFDVSQLSREKIQYGEAFCPYWRRVYQYSHGKFKPCYNSTYGNMEER